MSALPPQPNFFTLACADVERMADFLHARVNLATAEEVDRAYERLRDVDGVQLDEEPLDSPHGFRGFAFRDPERNVWEVAWKRARKSPPRAI